MKKLTFIITLALSTLLFAGCIDRTTSKSGGTAIINAYEHAKPGYGYGYRDGAGKQAIALLTKVAIASGIVFLTCLITFVVMTYLQATQATDVVVIKELLTQLK